MNTRFELWALRLCLVAGLCDVTTGILLITVPERTLSGMGVPPVAEPVFIGFIGAFVGCIGFLYWHPWWAGALGGKTSTHDLRSLLELTALCRLGVGLFVAIAVLSGRLDVSWCLVTATDWILAGAQIGLLRLVPWQPYSPTGSPADITLKRGEL